MASVVTNFLCNGQNPLTVGGTGVAVKFFPSAPGPSIGVQSTKNGYLFIPGSNEVNGQRLNVRATGSVTFGGDASSPTFLLGLYATIPNSLGVINSAPGFVTIVNPSAIAGGNANPNPFSLSVDMNCDNDSGILQGSYSLQYDNGTVVSHALDNALAGINMNANIPFALALGVTFSVSGTGNLAKLYQFDLQV